MYLSKIFKNGMSAFETGQFKYNTQKRTLICKTFFRALLI